MTVGERFQLKLEEEVIVFKIIRDESVEVFLEQTKWLLYRNESSNSLMLGLCEGMISNTPKSSPILIRIIENNETIAAAIQTPPMNLIITHADHLVLKALAEYLKNSGVDFPGVVGPSGESESFANEWSRLTGKSSQLGMGQKIYKLEKVNFPIGIKGSFCVATMNEFSVVFDWITAFAKESLPASDQRGEAHWRDFAKKAIENQTAHFWTKKDQPVAIAFISRPTKNGISIVGVYTPPEFRKNGYASAVVAHLSQKMLDAGKKFCVLYTDLANPTSNKIYQNIGYQDVSDSKLFLFN